MSLVDAEETICMRSQVLEFPADTLLRTLILLVDGRPLLQFIISQLLGYSKFLFHSLVYYVRRFFSNYDCFRLGYWYLRVLHIQPATVVAANIAVLLFILVIYRGYFINFILGNTVVFLVIQLAYALLRTIIDEITQVHSNLGTLPGPRTFARIVLCLREYENSTLRGSYSF